MTRNVNSALLVRACVCVCGVCVCVCGCACVRACMRACVGLEEEESVLERDNSSQI